MRKSRQHSAVSIATDFQTLRVLQINLRTVRGELHEMGFHGCTPTNERHSECFSQQRHFEQFLIAQNVSIGAQNRVHKGVDDRVCTVLNLIGHLCRHRYRH